MALLPSNGKLTCNKSDERRSMMNTLCVSALYLLDQRRKKVSNLQFKSELNKLNVCSFTTSSSSCPSFAARACRGRRADCAGRAISASRRLLIWSIILKVLISRLKFTSFLRRMTGAIKGQDIKCTIGLACVHVEAVCRDAIHAWDALLLDGFWFWLFFFKFSHNSYFIYLRWWNRTKPSWWGRRISCYFFLFCCLCVLSLWSTKEMILSSTCPRCPFIPRAWDGGRRVSSDVTGHEFSLEDSK